MIHVNKQIIIGYVGRDPMIKNLPNGNLVARFSVATTTKWKDRTTGEWQERTEWHQVEAWKHLAARVERDITKGSPVYVEGSTETQEWDDQKTGQKRSQKVVKAAQLTLLGERPHPVHRPQEDEDGAF